MKSFQFIILSIALIVSAFIFNGGLYKFETIQTGVVHKINILTGHIELCIFNNGCTSFPAYKKAPKFSILTLYRQKYPEYNDLDNDQLVSALHKKYTTELNLQLSKEDFSEFLMHGK